MRIWNERRTHSEAVAALAADPRPLVVTDEEGRLIGALGDAALRRAARLGIAEGAPVASLLEEEDLVVLDAGCGPDEAGRRLRESGAALAVELRDERPVAVHDRIELLSGEDRARCAVLMVGGEGTRLRPLTETLPKPLLPVGGRPILEHIVEHLVAHGVERAVLALGYRGDQIEAHFGDGSRFGLKIDYVREERPLGTAGAIGMVGAPERGPLLVMNGDLLTSLNLTAMAADHARLGSSVTVAARPFQYQVPYGVFRLVGERVVDVVEKPVETWWTNAGIYLMSTDLVATIERDRYLDMTMLMERVVAAGRPVRAFVVREAWCDIGRPEDYRRANEDWSGTSAQDRAR